jgi:hypothetical protein
MKAKAQYKVNCIYWAESTLDLDNDLIYGRCQWRSMRVKLPNSMLEYDNNLSRSIAQPSSARLMCMYDCDGCRCKQEEVGR